MSKLVVMGVSGCGKSSLAADLATTMGWPLLEGDERHPPENIAKMSAGQALTDADRAGWLNSLGQELAAEPGGVVLTCSALKRAYREQLRQAAPGLRFVHLALSREAAHQRLQQRPNHFFPPHLVDSQFAALQDPAGEPGVLSLDATATPAALRASVLDWLKDTA